MGRPCLPASFLLWTTLAFAAPVALADDRPSSGRISVLSGRTLGNGKTMVAAGVGWPGVWAELILSPSSRLDVALRGQVLYGSPAMGFRGGAGGNVTVRIRHHLASTDDLDVAAFVEPSFSAGEGSLAGQTGIFADNFGYVIQSSVGALLGATVSDAITLALGVGGELGYVTVADAATGSGVIGTVFGLVGVEALLSRDFLLFAELRGGYGFPPSGLFESRNVVRVSVGIGHLL